MSDSKDTSLTDLPMKERLLSWMTNRGFYSGSQDIAIVWCSLTIIHYEFICLGCSEYLLLVESLENGIFVVKCSNQKSTGVHRTSVHDIWVLSFEPSPTLFKLTNTHR